MPRRHHESGKFRQAKSIPGVEVTVHHGSVVAAVRKQDPPTRCSLRLPSAPVLLGLILKSTRTNAQKMEIAIMAGNGLRCFGSLDSSCPEHRMERLNGERPCFFPEHAR